MIHLKFEQNMFEHLSSEFSVCILIVFAQEWAIYVTYSYFILILRPALRVARGWRSRDAQCDAQQITREKGEKHFDRRDTLTHLDKVIWIFGDIGNEQKRGGSRGPRKKAYCVSGVSKQVRKWLGIWFNLRTSLCSLQLALCLSRIVCARHLDLVFIPDARCWYDSAMTTWVHQVSETFFISPFCYCRGSHGPAPMHRFNLDWIVWVGTIIHLRSQ